MLDRGIPRREVRDLFGISRNHVLIRYRVQSLHLEPGVRAVLGPHPKLRLASASHRFSQSLAQVVEQPFVVGGVSKAFLKRPLVEALTHPVGVQEDLRTVLLGRRTCVNESHRPPVHLHFPAEDEPLGAVVR